MCKIINIIEYFHPFLFVLVNKNRAAQADYFIKYIYF
jgi:hypothetical protein